MGATCDTGEKSLLLNQHFYDNRAISRADWLRAGIDKCKSDGNDEMMAQFILFFLSDALFFNKLQRKWTSMKSVNIMLIVKKKIDKHGPLCINLLTI